MGRGARETLDELDGLPALALENTTLASTGRVQIISGAGRLISAARATLARVPRPEALADRELAALATLFAALDAQPELVPARTRGDVRRNARVLRRLAHARGLSI